MSDVLQIPVPAPGTPLWDERITLDGVEYVLRFDWHDREKRWYFDVIASDGTVITAGIKMIPNWPLYSRETLGNAPKGNFVVYSADLTAPQLPDFGVRTLLFYVTP